MNMKRFIFASTLVSLSFVHGFAQTVAPMPPVLDPKNIVDFSPIIDTVMPLLMAVLSALAAWIGWYVKNLIASKIDLSKTQMDEKLQQIYNEAAARSIAYAESALKGAIPKEANIQNQFVQIAANYLVTYWPDLIKKVNLTPELVRATIIARLPGGIMTEKADAIVLAKASGSPSEQK